MEMIAKLMMLFCLFGIKSSIASSAKDFLSRQTFMAAEAAEKKWGVQPFDEKKFKKGDQKTRASMAVSLLRSKKYVGKPFSIVRRDLGDWDGYFETDSIPAYLIESPSTGGKEAWQILFVPDKTGKNVAEVKIHKNCCE